MIKIFYCYIFLVITILNDIIYFNFIFRSRIFFGSSHTNRNSDEWLISYAYLKFRCTKQSNIGLLSKMMVHYSAHLNLK